MTRTAVPSLDDAAGLEAVSGRTAGGTRPFVTRMRRLAGEPFVHFTLLGAMVFTGHRLVARASEAPTIEVSTSKQRELAKLFEQRQRRQPTDAERRHMIQRYVEDEVLFREGLRLSLVDTDPMLRAQLIARVRGMLQAELEGKPPSDAELEGYYAAHRADYATDGSAPPLPAIRERVSADYRKDRTARAFQAEIGRLTSAWRVDVAEQP